MALPVPNLDDRRFQDLVDDAKRLVQQRCPEWTDHNVSDPGVTLIEAFAWMTDQLLYRLNRVPDRHYVKFLELIGVRLFPPTAARGEVTFWLSAAQPDVVRIAGGTQVATVRTETDDAIVFTTLDDLPIVPVTLAHVLTTAGWQEARGPHHGGRERARLHRLRGAAGGGQPAARRLSEPAPANVVRLDFRCTIEGVGVDPTWPPLAWEAWTGDDWTPCELERDATGGLNRDGDVVLHVPTGHAVSVVEKLRAGWLRARVTEPEEGQPFYSASPERARRGGLHHRRHDRRGPRRRGRRRGHRHLRGRGRPALPPASDDRSCPATGPPSVRVSDDEDGWEEWTQVPDFAGSGPDDRHFVLDAVAGEISFGPAVREPDGSVRSHGAVPAKGRRIKVDVYRTGGGRLGNVAPRSISILKSSIPYVSRVENRQADGGRRRRRGHRERQGPRPDHAPHPRARRDHRGLRAPRPRGGARAGARPRRGRRRRRRRRLRAGPRRARGAAAEAAPSLRAARPVGRDAGPRRGRLDETRVVGTRVIVEPPVYRGITIVARLRPRPRVTPARLQEDALRALYAYFNPITGGPEGTGWPFGRPVQMGEVYSVLQRVRGTELVEDVRLFGADPITGQRGQATQRLDLEPHALVFSYEHQLMVEED